MRAYATAGKQEWISFTDGVDGPFVVALTDLSDILGNVDFGGAGLATGRQAIGTAIEVHQAFGHGFDLHDILGANRFTGTAPDTFFLIDHRVPCGPHFYGIELAGIDTVAQPDASDGADPLASRQGCLRSAGVDTEVDKFIGSPQAAAAWIKRFGGLGQTHLDTHDFGRLGRRFRTADDADVGIGFADHHRYGCSRTSGIAASAAIGSCKTGLYPGNARIFIYVKDSGCRRQYHRADNAQTEHENDTLDHHLSLAIGSLRERMQLNQFG